MTTTGPGPTRTPPRHDTVTTPTTGPGPTRTPSRHDTVTTPTTRPDTTRTPSRHDTVTTPATNPDTTRTPSRHDTVTMPCPVCERRFTPAGRRKFCSDACRAAAYRRRRDAHQASPPNLPKAQPRRPVTVYQCDNCGARALGQQRCEDCATFTRRVGIGGCCPSCDEPVAITELLDAGGDRLTPP